MNMRACLISLLVAGSALIAGHATAQYQIPAIAGLPGWPNYVNSFFPDADIDGGVQYWNWGPQEGFIFRTAQGPSMLPWLIPLPFYQSAKTSNDWTARIYVSEHTKCRLEWRADDLPGTTPVGSSHTTWSVKGNGTGDGPLDLCDPSTRCPSPGASGCNTDYATAFVLCFIPPNGFVGPVTYTITPPSADAATD
jgi:hypothetical protein